MLASAPPARTVPAAGPAPTWRPVFQVDSPVGLGRGQRARLADSERAKASHGDSENAVTGIRRWQRRRYCPSPAILSESAASATLNLNLRGSVGGGCYWRRAGSLRPEFLVRVGGTSNVRRQPRCPQQFWNLNRFLAKLCVFCVT
jgi:hypothetical protein